MGSCKQWLARMAPRNTHQGVKVTRSSSMLTCASASDCTHGKESHLGCHQNMQNVDKHKYEQSHDSAESNANMHGTIKSKLPHRCRNARRGLPAGQGLAQPCPESCTASRGMGT